MRCVTSYQVPGMKIWYRYFVVCYTRYNYTTLCHCVIWYETMYTVKLYCLYDTRYEDMILRDVWYIIWYYVVSNLVLCYDQVFFRLHDMTRMRYDIYGMTLFDITRYDVHPPIPTPAIFLDPQLLRHPVVLPLPAHLEGGRSRLRRGVPNVRQRHTGSFQRIQRLLWGEASAIPLGEDGWQVSSTSCLSCTDWRLVM